MVSGKEVWANEYVENMTFVDTPSKTIYTYPELTSVQSLYMILERAACIKPNAICVVDNNREYSFKEVYSFVDTFSKVLVRDFAVERQQNVSIVLSNCIEFYIALFALSKIGAVAVCIPSKYTQEGMCSLISKAKSSIILCEQKFTSFFSDCDIKTVIEVRKMDQNHGFEYLCSSADSYTSVEYIPSLDDFSLLIFTSGTTSQSKGVILRNYNIMHGILAYSSILKIDADAKTIAATPLYNITGIVGIIGFFMYELGTVYIHTKFEDKAYLDCIKDEKISFIHASPTLFAILIKNIGYIDPMYTVKTLVCGSSNMSPENIHKLSKLFPNMAFRTVYGLTESSSPGTIFPSNAETSEFIGSSGIPIPGMSIKIVDDNNKEVRANFLGEIAIKGTNVLEHYYAQEVDTIDADGWLKTGDIGFINEKGFLFVADRKKDLINKGGEKICSFDVENCLQGIDGILESALVAKSDKKYGEIPVALIKVVDSFNLSEAEIKEILSRKLARYEVPVHIIFVEEILKTENGKIDKKTIRSMVEKLSIENR